MKNVAITINYSDNPESIFYSNGLSQNVKFFYDLLELLGYRPYLLIPIHVEGGKIDVLGKKYRVMMMQALIESKKEFAIVFEAGVSIHQQERALLRKNNGAKIVCIRYGNSIYMDMEQMAHGQTLTPGIYITKPEVVWASPHFKNSFSYVETIYDAEVKECPFIWEPDFLKHERFLSGSDYKEVPEFFVMEPNISIIKNALVPMAIVERLYREKPESFKKATVLNGLKFNQQEYFLQNLVKNMGSLISTANKVYFTGRYKFIDVFKQRDILISHQHGCSLNYLYFEALWAGVPLVHNSPFLADIGYYYPEFDVKKGAEKCLEAIQNRNVVEEIKRNEAFLAKFSIHNKQVQHTYRLLLKEVLEMPQRALEQTDAPIPVDVE